MSDTNERVSVKTYIPSYQKETWKKHAESLNMSQSEFIRTMVQAGRRDFHFEEVTESNMQSTHPDEKLETRVLESLAREDNMSWDELVERLAGNFEDRLDDVLNELQAKNRVQYSGHHGGYVLVGGVDGNE